MRQKKARHHQSSMAPQNQPKFQKEEDVDFWESSEKFEGRMENLSRQVDALQKTIDKVKTMCDRYDEERKKEASDENTPPPVAANTNNWIKTNNKKNKKKMLSTRRFSNFLLGRALSTSSALKSSEISVKEERPYVYNVKLNRPTKLNTFTMEMWREFKKVIDGLADDPKCRSIIISGEGKVFCAGIDLAAGLTNIVKIIQDDKIEIGRKGRAVRRFIGEIQDCHTALEKCSKPVIAAIHSHCLGAGIDLITACDIRIASQDANFSIREVDIGLAADVGTLNRIQKVVGNDSWTREIAFTARDFGPDEALRFGLISRIHEDRQSLLKNAVDLAARISEKSPIAVQGTKETLNYAREHSTDDSLNFIKTWNMSQLLSTDLMNSAMAAMNKKKATYEDV